MPSIQLHKSDFVLNRFLVRNCENQVIFQLSVVLKKITIQTMYILGGSHLHTLLYDKVLFLKKFSNSNNAIEILFILLVTNVELATGTNNSVHKIC